MDYHSAEIGENPDIAALERKTLDDIGMPEEIALRHASTHFLHLFSGDGYAAGYYSYLWADVLAADAFSRFEEEGIFNRETGQSFLDNILTRGGSEEPMELFKRFRGREPQLDAMLEHYGIKG
jgi:Zn-dependent oligopeptidase